MRSSVFFGKKKKKRKKEKETCKVRRPLSGTHPRPKSISRTSWKALKVFAPQYGSDQPLVVQLVHGRHQNISSSEVGFISNLDLQGDCRRSTIFYAFRGCRWALSIRAPFYTEGFMKPMGILERHIEALISKDIESGNSTSGKNWIQSSHW